ncbi:MAG: ATP-binding cassette domain-containing protein [Acidimicrobiales bacterium]|nr:ATP-binding cassette domain-containing protein [Acidimicrobiales bacterium]
MQELLRLVVPGVVAGGLYAMLAAGVVLTYQTSGIFNFAHGAVAFATAFLFFQLDTGLGWPVWLAALVSIVIFAPLLGLALDRVIFRRIAGAPVVVKLVVPLALLVVIPAACLFVVDRLNEWVDAGLPTQDQILAIPGLGPSPKTTWRFQGPLDGVLIDSNQVIILAAALLCSVGLWVLLRHTALGLHMRAVVDRRSLAGLRGVDADRTSAYSWVIGSFLAGLAGVLMAPIFTLNPPSFTTAVLVSSGAVVLARFRSIPVALLGGLLLGVVQNLVAGYADVARSISGFRTSVPFIVLFVLLFFFGSDRSRRAGVGADTGAAPPPETGSVRRKAVVWGVWTGVLLGYVFLFADDYWRSLIARGLALGLVLLSFTIVTGIGGMVSLAQAAFVTVAGFTAGWALSHGWPFLLALAAGTLVAAVVGAIVSLPARRLGGLPLALSTMALAFIGQHLVFQLDSVSNADRGGWRVPPPTIGPFDFADRTTMIVGLVVLSAVACRLVHNLTVSASGRAMIALRSTEPGAVTSGIRSGQTKVAVFALSAAMAGFGGVLLVSTTGRVSSLDFPTEVGFFWLTSAVVFGIRRPAGAVLAGLATAVSPEVFGWVSDGALLPQLMFGLAAVNLAQNPDGILAIAADARRARSRRTAERRARSDRGLAPAITEPGPEPVAEGAAATVTGDGAASDGTGGDDAGTTAVIDVRGRTAGAGADAEVALELVGVRAGHGDVEVVHGVDLVIARGTVTALIGANGAGKSTLCCVVAGLVTPSAGVVRLDGADVTDLPPHRRVAQGAFLIPEGRGIFPALTVDENLAMWLVSPGERDAAYERFPALAGRRAQAAGSLSGGEQQMLALAPALVRPPLLLVVDEPSLGLAPLVVTEVYDALRELRDRGTAVMLVEEKANDVLALADTVAFLRVGHVAWAAPAAEVDEARLVESYLGIQSGEPVDSRPARA